MNITIVEDELEILHGIESCLKDKSVGNIFAYDNAEDALDNIQRIQPEIIITDIVLPRMSGLDLIVQSKSPRYQPKVVVISSYSNFEYAQRSLKLGAIDYLLKPIDVRELSQKVDALAELIEEETHRFNDIRDRHIVTQQGAQYLKEKFVRSLCMQKTALHEYIVLRLQMWNLSWLCEQSCVVIMFDCRGMHIRHNEKELEIKSFAIHNIVSEILEHYPRTALFKNALHQWVLITADDEHELIETIRKAVREYQRYDLVFGISDRTHAFESLSEAYEQSVQAYQYAAMNREQGILYYHELRFESDGRSSPSPTETIDQAILEGDVQAVREHMEAALRSFAQSDEWQSWREFTHKCYGWLIDIIARLSLIMNGNFNDSPIELWKTVEACESLEDLEAAVGSHLEEITLQCVPLLLQSNESHGHFIIERTKKLLEERYGEPIIQQTLAEELQIHPVWLSQLFKKETGRNFLDYLTEIRMEKAKEMLRGSNQKIYEIANAIGYRDIQYFRKLFKKWTGYTPKEYRYGK